MIQAFKLTKYVDDCPAWWQNFINEWGRTNIRTFNDLKVEFRKHNGYIAVSDQSERLSFGGCGNCNCKDTYCINFESEEDKVAFILKWG